MARARRVACSTRRRSRLPGALHHRRVPQGMIPLHLAHVIHTLQIGGTESGVVNLVTTLRDGFRHTVISMTGDGPLADRLPAGTPVYYLRKRPILDLRTVARLARLLRDLAPDVVHSRNWAAFDAIPAARMAGI